MKPVVFLDIAEEEMVEAARFYEQQAAGLGGRYLQAMERAVSLMRNNPLLGPVVASSKTGMIRRMLVHRFPYGLLYRIDEQRIIVLSVMHLRRKPGYWNERV